MALSKKDYALIAGILNRTQGDDWYQYHEVVKEFIRAFQENDSRFDAQRFAAACTELPVEKAGAPL